VVDNQNLLIIPRGGWVERTETDVKFLGDIKEYLALFFIIDCRKPSGRVINEERAEVLTDAVDVQGDVWSHNSVPPREALRVCGANLESDALINS
jgi:hypothetical protein